MNIGSEEHITIKKLAKLIAKSIKYTGKIKFDNNFPDGTHKKNLNSSKIRKLGWKSLIKLQSGIHNVVKTRLSKWN